MKYLPTKVNSKGFTLIELLVVISIIAVLAVIALSVFGNVQKSARDSRRRAEIDAIAKSFEVSRNPANQSYNYTDTNRANDFPNPAGAGSKVPVDPLSGSNGTNYCIATSTTQPPVPPAAPSGADLTGWTGAACPSGYTVIDDTTVLTNIASFSVCAKIETDGSAFCKTSLVR